MHVIDEPDNSKLTFSLLPPPPPPPPRSKVPKVVEKLTKTQIIKHLLTLARDANKPEVRENCAILLAKLAQKDSRHLERLRELHGIEILHSCMKFIKH